MKFLTVSNEWLTQMIKCSFFEFKFIITIQLNLESRKCWIDQIMEKLRDQQTAQITESIS